MTPSPIDIETTAAEPSSEVSERRGSGWDIRNAPKNYFWLILAQGGSALSSFAASWFLTRPQYLDRKGFGAVIAVILASQIAQVMVNWTSIAVVRYGVDEFIETSRIARTFWIRFIVLAVNMVLVLALANVWFPPLAEFTKLPPGIFWLVLFHFIVTALWLHVQMGMQGAKMMRLQGILQMFERLAILAGVLVLIAMGRLDFDGAVICYIVGPGLMFVVGMIALRSLIFSRFHLDVAFVKKILLYSLPLLPFTLVGYFSGSYVDGVFVTKFLSKEDLAVYFVATQTNGIAMQLPTLANAILLPLFVTLQAESDKARSSNYFRNILPALTLVWGVACGLMGFAAYYLIPLAYRQGYEGASVPVWILFAASVASIPVVIGYSALANSASKTYVPMIGATVSAAVNIGANLVLIPKYGLVGCALATLIAYFLSSAAFAVLLNRYEQMPVSWTFFAMVPSLVGVAVIAAYDDPPLALGTAVAVSCIVAFFQKRSLNEVYSFILGLRGKVNEPR